MIFLAGAANTDPFYGAMRSATGSLVTVGIWFVVVFLGTIPTIVDWKRTRSRVKVVTFILMVIPPILILAGFLRPSGHKRYEEGFTVWADRHVDVPSIRTWLATRSAVTAPAPVPATDWPAAITRLTPDEVDELQEGLAITWGQTAEFSSRRQVFVTAEGKTPPTTIKWADHWQESGPGAWHPCKPGIYTSVQ